MVVIHSLFAYRVVSGIVMTAMTIPAIFGNMLIITTMLAVRKKNPGYFLIACKETSLS